MAKAAMGMAVGGSAKPDDMADGRDVLRQRSDLSTFLIHLTQKNGKATAKQCLESIVTQSMLKASTPMGIAAATLNSRLELEIDDVTQADLDSQRVVCFTEAPLDMVRTLIVALKGRRRNFEPYGIAIPKPVARKAGVNPVWYLDHTPGHDFLGTHHVEPLIEEAIRQGSFHESHIAAMTPFIEVMGTWEDRRKEFWWEREWRHVGDLDLHQYLGLCPEDEIGTFEKLVPDDQKPIRFIDPRWSLDEMIAVLAGFRSSTVRVI